MTTVLEQPQVAQHGSTPKRSNSLKDEFDIVFSGLQNANTWTGSFARVNFSGKMNQPSVSSEESQWYRQIGEALVSAGDVIASLWEHLCSSYKAWKRNDHDGVIDSMKLFLELTRERNVVFPERVYYSALSISGQTFPTGAEDPERAPFMCDEIQQCLELLNQPVAKPDTDTQTPAAPPQKAEPPTQKPVASQPSQKKDWKQQALEWWHATVKWFREFTQAMTSPSQRKIIDTHNERLRAPAQQTAQSDAVAQPIKREEVAR